MTGDLEALAKNRSLLISLSHSFTQRNEKLLFTFEADQGCVMGGFWTEVCEFCYGGRTIYIVSSYVTDGLREVALAHTTANSPPGNHSRAFPF